MDADHLISRDLHCLQEGVHDFEMKFICIVSFWVSIYSREYTDFISVKVILCLKSVFLIVGIHICHNDCVLCLDYNKV